jgi:hypothetical protein
MQTVLERIEPSARLVSTCEEAPGATSLRICWAAHYGCMSAMHCPDW